MRVTITNTKELAKQRLLHALVSIHFSERYYRYYEQTRQRSPQELITHENILQALDSTGFDFKFDTREKFFYHREKHDVFQVSLHIAFTSSAAEFILAVKTPVGSVGGPFSLLAEEVALQYDAGFSYLPPYPDPLFSNLQELQEVILFGISLFEDAKQAFLSSAERRSPILALRRT